jgi:hypothetical protein
MKGRMNKGQIDGGLLDFLDSTVWNHGTIDGQSCSSSGESKKASEGN